MVQQQKNRCHQTGLCNILKIPFAWRAHATELSNLLFPPSWFHKKKTWLFKLNVQHMMHQKKNGSHSNHIDQFYKLFCRAHKFAYAENAPLANNRISNVWIMVSQRYKQKMRQFLFSIAPNQPAWPQICAADHRGLNVVTIYFMFFFNALRWQTLPLTLSRAFFPSFEQIFKWFCRTLGNNNKKIGKKTARWERSSGKQNKWNNYTVRYWIELNMHTYYYLLLLLLLYYFYFERRTRKKEYPSKSTVC